MRTGVSGITRRVTIPPSSSFRRSESRRSPRPGIAAKDLVAHLGSWLAEAGAVLERIRFGTYRPGEIDIETMNRTFYDAWRDVPFPVVRAQGVAARNRMLRAWRSLPEASPEADRWIAKAGPDHYAEHLPRLREWVHELAGEPHRATSPRVLDIPDVPS